MDIVTELEARKLATMKQTFNTQVSGNIANLSYFDGFKEMKSALRCTELSMNAFESEKFVVTCIGMLKSGKSTLVNLLSRCKMASPTGYGFDTTLRPALITYSNTEEGSIDIWIRNNPETPLSKDMLREIFQHLRGVNEEDEVTCAVRHSFKLTESNLKNALCKPVEEVEHNMFASEPAMVVIKVPRNPESVLSEEITILDTPGLDSGLSEWTKNGWYDWIVDNSDLILFLQSSFAPLNSSATEVLKRINEQDRRIPIWLLQNEMIGKPWLEPGQIKDINEEQRSQAAKMFKKIKICFQVMNANLGKADTVVFDDEFPAEKKPALMTESDFSTMESSIREDLKKNIVPFRRSKCIDTIKNDARQLSSLLVKRSEALKQEISQLTGKITSLQRLKTRMEETLLPDPQDGIAYKCVADENEIYFQSDAPFQMNLFYGMLDQFSKHSFVKDEYTAEEIEKILEDVRSNLLDRVKDMISKTSNQHFYLKRTKDDGKTKSCLMTIQETFMDYVEKKIANHMNKAANEFITLDDIKSLANIDLKAPTFKPYVNADLLFDIPVSVSKNTFFLVFEKKRNGEEVRRLFCNYYESVRHSGEFVDALLKCENEIRQEVFSYLNTKSFDAMRNNFCEQFGARIDAMSGESQKQLDKVQQDLNIISEMQKVCTEIKTNMESF